jgi:hypothetical protein
MIGPAVPDSLFVRPGQEIEARHHNELVRLAEQLTIQRSGLRGRQMPDGFTPRVEVSQTISAEHRFTLAVEDGGDGKLLLSWSQGLIGGVEPVIGEKKISELDDQTGQPPKFEVTPDDFGDDGRCLVYFQIEVDHISFLAVKVTPAAFAKKPGATAWMAFKLAGILAKDGDGAVTAYPRLFFDQGFAASEKKSSGMFRAWFWST